MSTNVKTADLAITIIVSLLKAAGLGPEADRILDAIEGAKDCIGRRCQWVVAMSSLNASVGVR